MSTLNSVRNSVNTLDSARLSRVPIGQGAVIVEGNRISWADNGWYEIQSATSYNTLSEGGTSATMPNGIYNIINHTTGERFDNIVVGESQRPSDNEDSDQESSSSISGDVIVGGDVDFAIMGGGSVSVGVVVDLDTPLDSGVYVTTGFGAGGTVGVGLEAGYSFGDIEGDSDGIDINGPGIGVGWGVGAAREVIDRKVSCRIRLSRD